MSGAAASCHRALAALAVGALVLVGGCGGAPPAQPSGAGSTVGAAEETAAARGTVRVGLFEWSIVTSTRTVTPGRVKLVVTNTGGTEHDLAVQGRAGRWESPVLEPGQRTSMTVRARPGETLALWCAEPGHREQGMHTTLRVQTQKRP